ncbi:hypothetical protein L596_009792 [Steinernema carpocapsae]|uniref:Uncharacterized protein n=1 Tax=Steinernema carpocapsae TaxID=34508 RepID=A0A4V6A6N9_STECR|nr:hypothetical protein L596_009792 [Steinernema carpocapsae]
MRARRKYIEQKRKLSKPSIANESCLLSTDFSLEYRASRLLSFLWLFCEDRRRNRVALFRLISSPSLNVAHFFSRLWLMLPFPRRYWLFTTIFMWRVNNN